MNTDNMKASKRASRGPHSSSGHEPEKPRRSGLRIVDQLFARLQALIVAMVPLGYQDESGFHYGASPCRSERRADQFEHHNFVV